MLNNIPPVPKLTWATARFKPTLAFRMKVPASLTRDYARFHKLKAHRARLGKYILWYGNPALNEEMHDLRSRIERLESVVPGWAVKWLERARA